MLSFRSNAKINIGLFIKGKRGDGYHVLETLFYPVELADEMTLRKAEGNTDTQNIGDEKSSGIEIRMTGIAIEVDPEKHLCKKAYDALAERVGGLPAVELDLHKNIPAGAGLGGGSSNAAFTLVGLNELFNLGLSKAELADVAAPLGADVPFFVYNVPMIATGIGHDLEPFELDLPFEIRLVTPGIHSSTIAAYKGLDASICDPSRSLRDLLAQPFERWPEVITNDLELPVIGEFPEIGEIKQRLYAEGAIYAAMSGSGSAVFGLFEK